VEKIISIRLRDSPLVCAAPILFGIALATGLVWLDTPHSGWAKVTVDLPTSRTMFPAGQGADIASAQCLICHSAGMVLNQPPLTQDEWAGEINKMRNSFGAPLPAEQVEALAKYLRGIQGSQSPRGPSVLDGQGS
jgi:mono/diheme cytochrome c family protein